MKDTTTAVVSILLAIIGVAIISVVVSSRSNAPNVITQFGQTIRQMICVATSPVTGANCGTLGGTLGNLLGGLGGTNVTSSINYGGVVG